MKYLGLKMYETAVTEMAIKVRRILAVSGYVGI